MPKRFFQFRFYKIFKKIKILSYPMKKIYLGIILLILIISAFYITTQSFKPQSSVSQPSNISMVFTGDVMFGRGVESVLHSNQNVFGDLKPLFLQSDIVVINLESPFTNSNDNYKMAIPLKANPDFAHVLKDNNVNVVSLANNHIMDYGPSGLQDTLAALDKYNIKHIGAGENLDKAVEPAYFDIDNRKIAILNYFDKSTFKGFGEKELLQASNNESGSAPADWNVVKKSIDDAKNKSDIVVVTFHYGNEYSTSPNNYQTDLSRKCIDEGADLVIGTHPHVPQSIENYKGKLIFYSLGNCVFDQSNPATKDSMVVQLQVINGSAQVTVLPIHITGSIPRYMDNKSANYFLQSIKAESNTNMNIEDGKGKIDLKI